MDLYWIIFLFSDFIMEEALIVLYTDEMEEAPNKRNTLATLTEDIIFEILCRPLLLVLLQMCLLLLKRPHLGPQQL
jgi:hypothetical protein